MKLTITEADVGRVFDFDEFVQVFMNKTGHIQASAEKLELETTQTETEHIESAVSIKAIEAPKKRGRKPKNAH